VNRKLCALNGVQQVCYFPKCTWCRKTSFYSTR